MVTAVTRAASRGPKSRPPTRRSDQTSTLSSAQAARARARRAPSQPRRGARGAADPRGASHAAAAASAAAPSASGAAGAADQPLGQARAEGRRDRAPPRARRPPAAGPRRRWPPRTGTPRPAHDRDDAQRLAQAQRQDVVAWRARRGSPRATGRRAGPAGPGTRARRARRTPGRRRRAPRPARAGRARRPRPGRANGRDVERQCPTYAMPATRAIAPAPISSPRRGIADAR